MKSDDEDSIDDLIMQEFGDEATKPPNLKFPNLFRSSAAILSEMNDAPMDTEMENLRMKDALGIRKLTVNEIQEGINRLCDEVLECEAAQSPKIIRNVASDLKTFMDTIRSKVSAVRAEIIAEPPKSDDSELIKIRSMVSLIKTRIQSLNAKLDADKNRDEILSLCKN